MPNIDRIPLVFAGIIAFSGAAQAHAFLDTASPSVGSTLRGAPAQVRITFTEDLEPAFSTLRVEDAQGKQVDKNDTAVGPDAKLMHTSLPPLSAGTYQVIWRVLSVDGHVTEGKFKFNVAQ
jgi:methionine-rich copper-binding protein CopC